MTAAALCFACYNSSYGETLTVATDKTYGKPELVIIRGYSGPQQDPVITPDGKYLFFDTHNDAGAPPFRMHFAKRIDYKTFQYLGPLESTASTGEQQIEGVEDSNHNFYFISSDTKGTTIERGKFTGQTVTNIEPVRGITPVSPPFGFGNLAVNMDLYITSDGNTLYFTDAVFNPVTGPHSARASMAKKNPDGSFTRLPNSDAIVKNVNALGHIVYNAATADNRTLVFNVADTGRLYIATRPSTSVPFGAPLLVAAADNVSQGSLSEPGSISLDGKYLYFHRVLDKVSSQLYVLTRQ